MVAALISARTIPGITGPASQLHHLRRRHVHRVPVRNSRKKIAAASVIANADPNAVKTE